jgi:hypothetical protein
MTYTCALSKRCKCTVPDNIVPDSKKKDNIVQREILPATTVLFLPEYLKVSEPWKHNIFDVLQTWVAFCNFRRTESSA